MFLPVPMQGIAHERSFWNSQISKGSRAKLEDADSSHP